MTAVSGSWSLGALIVLGGCVASSSAAEPMPAQVGATSEPLRHWSGGYLEHARSSLVPFCHAVLVASDVVVTAAACADEGAWELSFGVGDVGSPTIPVERALLHADADDPRHALVALLLERPVRGARPAIATAPSQTQCDVEIPSYEVVLRGDASTRDVWTACRTEDGGREVFVARSGTPNCHGDLGAGAFLRAADGDRVIGWVTGAGYVGGPHPIDDVCVTDVELASVADNMEFIEAALALSRD